MLRLYILLLCLSYTAALPDFIRRSRPSQIRPLHPLVKQTTREEIVTRSRVVETRTQVVQAQRRWVKSGWKGTGPARYEPTPVKRDLPPKASASVVPRSMRQTECPDSAGATGWARYDGWELEFDDILRSAITVEEESECAMACKAYGPGCAGSQYIPTDNASDFNCILKGTAISTGVFTDESMDAQEEGTVLRLFGTCDQWSGTVPDEMDAICCNT